MDMNTLWQSLVEANLDNVGPWALRIVGALLVFLVGRALSRGFSRLVARLMERHGVDTTLVSFVRPLIYYTLLAAVVIATLGQIGINVTSFLAVLGAAGLAVGLALKDSLSNFAAGVMLILFRYFKKGDYVTVAGTSGTVRGINVFNTELTSPDNQLLYVPNASILGSVITNVTANETRRIDLVMGIGYADDIDKATAILHRVVSEESRVLADPATTIAVSELADSSVNFVVRPWVKTADYWAVRFALTENIKKAFDAEGISIPFPQRDIHIYQETGE